MTDIRESSAIAGVKVAHLRVFADERGRFMETFRKDWFPERPWNIIQSNRSDSAAGVLRGLHYHHHQVDYWHVVSGSIRVALADIRLSSPTHGAIQVMDITHEDGIGLFIPVGVAHGFIAHTPATLAYIVDNYYDGADELGVAWNDPMLKIDWGAERPLMSPRDQNNPVLSAIPAHLLPR
jgi:dTDP-4-dehydrorhamnose 3,5-epimerase